MEVISPSSDSDVVVLPPSFDDMDDMVSKLAAAATLATAAVVTETCGDKDDPNEVDDEVEEDEEECEGFNGLLPARRVAGAAVGCTSALSPKQSPRRSVRTARSPFHKTASPCSINHGEETKSDVRKKTCLKTRKNKFSFVPQS